MTSHARSRRRNRGAKFFDELPRLFLEQRLCASGRIRQKLRRRAQ
jgi:hypothetical protein